MESSFILELNQASNYIETNDSDSAIILLERLLDRNIDHASDFERGQLFSMLSVALEETGNIVGATSALHSAAELFEAAGDSQSLPHVYQRIGQIEASQLRWESAEEWFRKALAHAESNDNGPAMIPPLIGLIFISRRSHDFIGTLEYINKSAEINNYTKDLTFADFLGKERQGVEHLLNLQRVFLREFQKKKDEHIRKGDFDAGDSVSLAMVGIACNGGDVEEAINQLQILERSRTSRGKEISELREVIASASESLSLRRRSEARRVIMAYLENEESPSPVAKNEAKESSSVTVEIMTETLFRPFGDDPDSVEELIALRDKANIQGDRIAEAQASIELGVRLHRSGDLIKAEAELRRALVIGEQEDEYATQAHASRRLVEVLFDQRDFDAARVLSREYYVLSQRAGNARGQTMSLMNLAAADFLEGVSDSGRKYLRQALNSARESRDYRNEAECLFRLARLDSDEKQQSAAIKKLKAVIEIAREHSLDDILANALLQLSGVYWSSRKFHTEKLTEEAKSILLARGEIDRYAGAWRDASSASQGRKEYDRALVEVVEALKAYQYGPPSESEAVCFFQIGSILRDQDRRRLALEFMSVAIWLDTQLKSEIFHPHLEHASGLSSSWGLAEEFTEMALTAEQRYGVDRGQEMLKTLS